MLMSHELKDGNIAVIEYKFNYSIAEYDLYSYMIIDFSNNTVRYIEKYESEVITLVKDMI